MRKRTNNSLVALVIGTRLAEMKMSQAKGQLGKVGQVLAGVAHAERLDVPADDAELIFQTARIDIAFLAVTVSEFLSEALFRTGELVILLVQAVELGVLKPINVFELTRAHEPMLLLHALPYNTCRSCVLEWLLLFYATFNLFHDSPFGTAVAGLEVMLRVVRRTH